MDQQMHYEPTHLVTSSPGRIATASLREWLRHVGVLVFAIIGVVLLDPFVASAAATMGIREASAYAVLPILLVTTFSVGRLGLLWKHAIHARRVRDASLQCYVPQAVAAELLNGGAFLSGERDISVLFADLRGFTSFAERRAPAAIFSVAQRFAETTSAIVRLHGGTVVEFSGDGIMAVFGSPRPLKDKERAAVRAATAIIDALRPGDARRSDLHGLAVGVGIATGTDCVGNIQITDHAVWTAVGNTANLAARLQRLTRDLDAAAIVDADTWRAAGSAAAGFALREAVPIRGRCGSETVYVMPNSSLTDASTVRTLPGPAQQGSLSLTA